MFKKYVYESVPTFVSNVLTRSTDKEGDKRRRRSSRKQHGLPSTVIKKTEAWEHRWMVERPENAVTTFLTPCKQSLF